MTRARASHPTERLLVAFSGGARSVALAELLRRSMLDLRGRSFHVQMAFVDETPVLERAGAGDTQTEGEGKGERDSEASRLADKGGDRQGRAFVREVLELARGFGFEMHELALPQEGRECLQRHLSAILPARARTHAHTHTHTPASAVTEWERRRADLRLRVLLEHAVRNKCTRILLAGLGFGVWGLGFRV
jgi:hypothetical protein